MAKNLSASKKSEIKKKSSKGLTPKILRSKSKTVSNTTMEAALRWQEEIAELQNQSFATIEEAARHIGHAVVTKLNLPKDRVDEAQQFIEDILVTDPVAIDYIHKTVKIAHK